MANGSAFGREFGLLVKRRRAERGLSQDQLAALLWPDQTGPKDHPRKPDISRLETGRVQNPQEKTVLLLCEKLGIREDEVNALRLARPLDRYALAAVLDNLKDASRAELDSLAKAFGEERPGDLSDARLRAFLADKAQEYQSYRSTIDALDDRVAAIANLKGAAKDAAERLDFDTVEDLLSRVQTVELEIAAATAEARADNALLRNRVEQAHALLSAAADSFAAVDPLETARRRLAAGNRLGEHGDRYGGASLPLAICLLTRLIDDLPRAADPEFWAVAHNHRANALQAQGTRTAGAVGTALLAQAVADFTGALEVFTRADHPVGWAMTLQNRAGALNAQGTRTAGEAGAALLAQAVADYAGALEVFTRADHPVDWAGTLYNRANALRAQGTSTAGAAGAALLAQAVADCTDALEVRIRADHPVDWAMTRQNMARLELARALHDTCTDPLPHLRAALEHVEAALEVYDPEHMAFYHQKATALREALLSEIARLTPQS